MVIQRDSMTPFYYYDSELWTMLEDPLVESESENRVFFTDGNFDGDLKTLKFSFDYRVVENPTPLKIRLYSCNETTFKYFLAVERAMNSGPFSEPVKVPSNVTNGYGLFGGMSMKQRFFKKIRGTSVIPDEEPVAIRDIGRKISRFTKRTRVHCSSSTARKYLKVVSLQL